MGRELMTALEINELVNVYFKLFDKNENVNWDDFDLILQQILSFAMINEMPIDKFIERHRDVLTHFKRRATRCEYPAIRFIIYLNFAAVIQLDGQTINTLLRYGQNELYNKLYWPDKLLLLDISNRAQAPYLPQVLNKVSIDLMLSDYGELVHSMNLEGIIQMIALVRTITSQEDKASALTSGRVELWHKLQLLLVTSLEWRHEEFEYAEE